MALHLFPEYLDASGIWRRTWFGKCSETRASGTGAAQIAMQILPAEWFTRAFRDKQRNKAPVKK